MSADENNNASGTDNGAASQSAATPDSSTPSAPTVAQLQEQLREQQARATKAEQDKAVLQGEMDAMRPYVRYGNEEPGNPPANPNQPAEGEDVDPVVKLQGEVQTLRQELGLYRGEHKAETFLLRNQDLDNPIAQALLEAELRRTPGRTPNERLDRAATTVRKLLKDRDATILVEHEAAQVKKKKSVAALDGTMDGSATPPTPPEPEEKADLASYSAMRTAATTVQHGGGK